MWTPSVSGVCLCARGMAHSGHFEHICAVFVVQCVKLMLRIFEFGALLFDCYVCRQNVICLKRFARYGHYAGEVEDVIIGRLAVVS